MRLSDVGSEGRRRKKRRCRTIKKAWPFRLLNIKRRVFRGHENGTARISCLILKGRPLPDSTRQKIGKIILSHGRLFSVGWSVCRSVKSGKLHFQYYYTSTNWVLVLSMTLSFYLPISIHIWLTFCLYFYILIPSYLLSLLNQSILNTYMWLWAYYYHFQWS